ncbi:RHS repeat-associated core domain-containing protein [Bacillus cereus]|uniref:RHS repeat-associated core domain-containing protein n=1 Tax=Bacillus cereus TaxID=1396 RepID=UPI0009946F75|nr:RHS repeat-associated core domain-containing protein [Bacillus cereus]
MTDQNGEVVATYEYDSWGNVLKSDRKGIAADNPFGYAGYMYDKEIGMYYLVARYYNPNHGVFLSVDPDPGDEDDPVTQNGYTYGDNNPVMLTDPDGHAPWLIPVAIGGYRAYKGYKAIKKVNNYNKQIKKINKQKNRHSNSKRNPQLHHGYEIYNKRTKAVVKVGISGNRIKKNGKSSRAETQVRNFNKNFGNEYASRIVRKNLRGRFNAEAWEGRHVKYINKKQGKKLSKPFRSRP